MTKYMIRFSLSIFLLLMAINISGCSLAVDIAASHIDAKIDMDRQGETNQTLDIVWEATQLAVDELGIIVDSKNYDKKEAELGGHIGELDYIRIYLYKLTPHSTKVGVQARTALLPMTQKGYDLAYARKIMDTISKNINKVVASSKDEDNTYRPIEDEKAAEIKGEKIDINKYIDNLKGLRAVYDVKWQANNKQGSGQLTTKFLGQRTLNGKDTRPIQFDFNNFMTGKQKSSLRFYVSD
ncbi:MAG: DUF3568 family protein, partial [Candidatus Thermoplasmatota archaeon]|nr:DUF3568 family protein [Candidatus Thermoplasmatota archaeon]